MDQGKDQDQDKDLDVVVAEVETVAADSVWAEIAYALSAIQL